MLAENKPEKTVKLASVRFREGKRSVHVECGAFELKLGDMVMISTDHGLEPGKVTGQGIILKLSESCTCRIQRIDRIATGEEIARHRENLIKERDAFTYCLERIRELNLPMKLVSTEYFFDGSKIIFYFTSEGRIDFRELVKTLVHRFHTRIEMRQIGVRNETKLLGGMSHCGQELCCASYLSEFEPISIRMAKEQDLPLNPSKISGMCGRLLCCLAYEHKTYAALKKRLPKIGKKIRTADGETKVIRHNTLKGTIVIALPDGTEKEISLSDILTDAQIIPER